MVDIIKNCNIKKIEKALSDTLRAEKNIFPYPEMLFSAFWYTPYDQVKVVIMGQDPYFKLEQGIPLAMGLSFSVATGLDIPSSLDNVYRNLLKYNHISKKPNHGNLEFWARQGCLFLNTALTVPENEKNAHEDVWSLFTDSIIAKLSSEKENIAFVLWGGPALKKLNLIDKKKHKVIISSHPSGLSYKTPLKNYPAFADNDHFGQINNFLIEKGKQKIIYGL
jgi:uracil-DNA glycosylase